MPYFAAAVASLPAPVAAADLPMVTTTWLVRVSMPQAVPVVRGRAALTDFRYASEWETTLASARGADGGRRGGVGHRDDEATAGRVETGPGALRGGRGFGRSAQSVPRHSTLGTPYGPESTGPA